MGDIINQRQNIEDYEYGMLTAQLIDNHSKPDLKRLEKALALGDSNCKYFKNIFSIGKLPRNQGISDARILDMLAEVRAFEFLNNYSKKISYISQRRNTKKVDFTSEIENIGYAVEVTRIGLPQSNKKKSINLAEDSERIKIKNQEVDVTWVLLSAEDNSPVFENVINDAISSKYSQIKEYRQIYDKESKGVIAISFGRDYFVTKYARRDLTIFPNKIKEIIKKIWKEQKSIYQYLDYVIFLVGKNISKSFIYPNLSVEQNNKESLS